MEAELIRAVRCKDKVKVARLISEGVDVNCRSLKGNSALHLGIRAKDATIVHMLIAAGADINAKGADEKTPADWANALNYHEGTLMLNRAAVTSRTRE